MVSLNYCIRTSDGVMGNEEQLLLSCFLPHGQVLVTFLLLNVMQRTFVFQKAAIPDPVAISFS